MEGEAQGKPWWADKATWSLVAIIFSAGGGFATWRRSDSDHTAQLVSIAKSQGETGNKIDSLKSAVIRCETARVEIEQLVAVLAKWQIAAQAKAEKQSPKEIKETLARFDSMVEHYGTKGAIDKTLQNAGIEKGN